MDEVGRRLDWETPAPAWGNPVGIDLTLHKRRNARPRVGQPINLGISPSSVRKRPPPRGATVGAVRKVDVYQETPAPAWGNPAHPFWWIQPRRNARPRVGQPPAIRLTAKGLGKRPPPRGATPPAESGCGHQLETPAPAWGNPRGGEVVDSVYRNARPRVGQPRGRRRALAGFAKRPPPRGATVLFRRPEPHLLETPAPAWGNLVDVGLD